MMQGPSMRMGRMAVYRLDGAQPAVCRLVRCPANPRLKIETWGTRLKDLQSAAGLLGESGNRCRTLA